jgi:hypothetical protein
MKGWLILKHQNKIRRTIPTWIVASNALVTYDLSVEDGLVVFI